jgi:hypothetical protein
MPQIKASDHLCLKRVLYGRHRVSSVSLVFGAHFAAAVIISPSASFVAGVLSEKPVSSLSGDTANKDTCKICDSVRSHVYLPAGDFRTGPSEHIADKNAMSGAFLWEHGKVWEAMLSATGRTGFGYLTLTHILLGNLKIIGLDTDQYFRIRVMSQEIRYPS